MTYQIRQAAFDDADAIARVHVDAWRETYSGQLPDEVLDAATVEQRATLWRQVLADESVAPGLFVVLDEAGDIAGFVAGGRASSRGPEPSDVGEVFAIYLLRRVQHQGAGKALLRAVAAQLAATGCRSLGLWVMDINQEARQFYEAFGAQKDIGRTVHLNGAAVTETRYVWPEIGTLTA